MGGLILVGFDVFYAIPKRVASKRKKHPLPPGLSVWAPELPDLLVFPMPKLREDAANVVEEVKGHAAHLGSLRPNTPSQLMLRLAFPASQQNNGL